MPVLVAICECQVLNWGFPGLLDESVQKDHPAPPVKIEEHPRNPIIPEI